MQYVVDKQESRALKGAILLPYALLIGALSSKIKSKLSTGPISAPTMSELNI